MPAIRRGLRCGRKSCGKVGYNNHVIVTILLFASLADAAGRRRLEVASAPGDTVETVCQRVMAIHPELERFRPSLLFALNEEYAKPWAPVPAGATLALIPPVSGG